MKKSLLLNVVALVLGTLAAVVTAGVPLVPAAVFIALVLWLCNELWYWAISIPLLLAAVWSTAKKQRVTAGTENKFYRLTSFLLLVVPHLLFAALSLLDTVTGQQLSAQTGLPLSPALFGCAYAAVVLVWCCSLKRAVAPLSLEILYFVLVEPELLQARAEEDVAAAAAAPQGDAAAPSSSSSPRHPELQRVAAELLWYGRAVTEVSTPGNRSSVMIGGSMTAFALLFLAIAAQLYAVSALGALVAGVLGLVFGFGGYHMLQQPARWRRKLSAAEYGFSSTTVYIVEGDDIRTLPLDRNLNMHFEEVSGTVGNISLDHPDLHSNVFRKLLTQSGGVKTTTAYDLSAPLQGFVQIADAAQVYMQLKERK